ESLGARGERRPRHGDRTVTVGVCLHDRPDRARRDALADRAHVVLDGAEVDLGPGPATAHASDSNTAGRWTTTSLATSPRLGPRQAAEPWSHAPPAAASKAATPCASSAPIVPDS